MINYTGYASSSSKKPPATLARKTGQGSVHQGLREIFPSLKFSQRKYQLEELCIITAIGGRTIWRPRREKRDNAQFIKASEKSILSLRFSAGKDKLEELKDHLINSTKKNLWPRRGKRDDANTSKSQRGYTEPGIFNEKDKIEELCIVTSIRPRTIPWLERWKQDSMLISLSRSMPGCAKFGNGRCGVSNVVLVTWCNLSVRLMGAVPRNASRLVTQ